jgi:hypothetical protein
MPPTHIAQCTTIFPQCLLTKQIESISPHTNQEKKNNHEQKRFYTSVKKQKLLFLLERNPLREVTTTINNARETFYSNKDFKGLREHTSIQGI